MVSDSESEKSVVGQSLILLDKCFWKLPVKWRIKHLADANHHVSTDVRNNTQIVGYVQLRLARSELQFSISR